MAVKKIDEIMAAVRARIGEDTSDEALSFVEDIHDTLNSLSSPEMKIGRRSTSRTTQSGGQSTRKDFQS